MNRKHYYRLWVISILSVIAVIIIGLVLFALRQNINLFFTPTQIQEGKVAMGKRIRVGGLVEKGSVIRGFQNDNLKVQFIIKDEKNALIIQHRGILPDLFREGQGVVALGVLLKDNKDNAVFLADEILAKHDEYYNPKELQVRNKS